MSLPKGIGAISHLSVYSTGTIVVFLSVPFLDLAIVIHNRLNSYCLSADIQLVVRYQLEVGGGGGISFFFYSAQLKQKISYIFTIKTE